jgi:hypothetical protein
MYPKFWEKVLILKDFSCKSGYFPSGQCRTRTRLKTRKRDNRKTKKEGEK